MGQLDEMFAGVPETDVYDPRARKQEARRALMARNLIAMRGSPQVKMELADLLAKKRAQDYAAMNPDMNRRFGPEANRRIGPDPQSMANVPDAPNPLDGTALRGDVSPDGRSAGPAGVRSALAPGFNPAEAQLHAALTDPAYIKARTKQGDDARANAAAMKELGISRPTQHSANMERLNKRLEIRDRIMQAEKQHELDMYSAANGMKNQLQQSQINQNNAAANASNVNAVGNGGNPVPFGQVPTPGAQPAAPPPMTWEQKKLAVALKRRQEQQAAQAVKAAADERARKDELNTPYYDGSLQNFAG